MNTKRLEDWFIREQRDLNFRKTLDPYHIWVSEIMLQQTKAETVEPYFERFIQWFPTIESLAIADPDRLRKAVEGIGYYRRFSNMQKAAKLIVEKHEGKFPNDEPSIAELPGIGRYTLGAILSIAFDYPKSALDGNVLRVLSRYYGFEGDLRKERERKKLDAINQENIVHAHPRVYTQALIELGALICRPKQPKCTTCPISENCVAYHQDATDQFPYLSKLKKQSTIHYIVCVLEDDLYYYLTKRKEALLEGMYAYPQYEYESLNRVEEELINLGVIFFHMDFIGNYRHIFSHQIWEMDVYRVVVKSVPDNAFEKVLKTEIEQKPMAIAHRKIKTA